LSLFCHPLFGSANFNLNFNFTLQADALVCSVGATSQAITQAGVPLMATLNVGDSAVSSGQPLAKHVISTCCGQWNGGEGEAVSLFFLFPCTDASQRWMSRGGTVERTLASHQCGTYKNPITAGCVFREGSRPCRVL